MPVQDILKQGQAVISGLLPALSTTVPIFPFLNPQIQSDLWPLATCMAFLTSAGAYNMFLLSRTAGATVGIAGLIATIGAVSAMIVLSTIDVFASQRTADLTVRLCYVLAFAGAGLVLGWCMAQIMGTKHSVAASPIV